MIDDAWAKGEAIGFVKGEEVSLAKGEEIGLAKGEEIGLAKAEKIMALNMLNHGYSVEEVAKVTGLSQESIQALDKGS